MLSRFNRLRWPTLTVRLSSGRRLAASLMAWPASSLLKGAHTFAILSANGGGPANNTNHNDHNADHNDFESPCVQEATHRTSI